MPEIRPQRRLSRVIGSGPVLLLAFAFAVMADPVSSVAYAVEAALRALNGDLALLVPTMLLVVAVIAMVIVNYQQIVRRYPNGGGAAAAVGEAFGDGLSFIPIGALIVDFVLTIAISVAAGSSAIIAYFPGLAPWRVELALVLVVIVAGITWFGHIGRIVFALMTLAFVAVALTVLIFGIWGTPDTTAVIPSTPPGGGLLAIAFAFPVAMALATGVEAPSSAIAQLGGLNDDRRRMFGRVTLWLTLGIVGTITIGLSVQATILRIGIPTGDSTMIAELARHVAPPAVFAAFQLFTTLLLLAAASSSFQAGPGLLKAFGRDAAGKNPIGILPRPLGVTNSAHTPYWGVVLFAVLAMIIVVIAGGNDQVLVLFYAVAVFMSFLAGLLAFARFSYREKNWPRFALNLLGTTIVAFTLVINLGRIFPLVSLAAALLIAGALYGLWVRAGRPSGVRNIEAIAEADQEQL